jgi:two-component system, LytTR family, response regulator LytT
MDIMIIEDEPKAANLLKEFVEKIDSSNRIVHIADSIESAVRFLQGASRQLDLLFMDIQIADGLSFEIFKQVKIDAPVVFCTAYEQYAMEAFKSNGIDYILKPFEEKDIEAAFLKLEKLQQVARIDAGIADKLMKALDLVKKSKTSFLIRFRGKMIPVPAKDVAVIALENETPYLYQFNKEKHPVFKTIDDIDAQLDSHLFFRINRQMIINRDAIKDIEPFFNRKVIVNLVVPTVEKPVVSRLKVAPFLSWVENV